MAVSKIFDVALDIKRPISHRDFTVINGDNGNRLNITLTDGDSPVDLTGCRVIAAFAKADGSTSMQDSGTEDGGVTLGGEEKNQVEIELFPASFCPGMVECELQIYSDQQLSTLVTTARFNFTCRQAIMNEDTVQASSEYPLLRAMAESAQETLDSLSSLAERISAAEEERRQAVERLEGMTAQAHPLPAGEAPTAELIRDEEGGLLLSLGLLPGPQGETGHGLILRDTFPSLQELVAAVPSPSTGDAYGIGAAPPYNAYIFNGSAWVDYGAIQGPAGAVFRPEISDAGVLSWSNDGGLENPAPFDIAANARGSIETGSATTIDGLLKGDGESLSAAVSGQDYLSPAATADALPPIGTALTDNTYYNCGTITEDYIFSAPAAWAAGNFTVGEGVTLAFAGAPKEFDGFLESPLFSGEPPVLEAGKTYDFRVRNGVWDVRKRGGYAIRCPSLTYMVLTTPDVTTPWYISKTAGIDPSTGKILLINPSVYEVSFGIKVDTSQFSGNFFAEAPLASMAYSAYGDSIVAATTLEYDTGEGTYRLSAKSGSAVRRIEITT